MSSSASPTQAPTLPPAVAAELAQLEAKVGQVADGLARRRIAELGEAVALSVLQRIGKSREVRTLSGYITWFAKREAATPTDVESPACSPGSASLRKGGESGRSSPGMQIAESESHGLESHLAKMAINVDAVAPAKHESAATQALLSSIVPNSMMVHAGRHQAGSGSTQPELQQDSVASRLHHVLRCLQGVGNPLGSECAIMLPKPAPNNVVAEYALTQTASLTTGAGSPRMQALGGLEFTKRFLIISYLCQNKIENEDALTLDYIESLKTLSMAQFESQIWIDFGMKSFKASDRATSERTKIFDSDPSKSKVYHCNYQIRGNSVEKVFKGPYTENLRTHLQKVIGDDNVLVVKFMHNPSDTDFSTYQQHYQKVVADGITLGLRHYSFFAYKDGRKKKKTDITSSIRCFFVRTKSEWMGDKDYILSHKTIDQCRQLFMHIHTAPTLGRYMDRFSLILSKTLTLEADLSTADVILIDDEPCRDEHGEVVYQDGERLIHTDGTGFISEDLAKKCPKGIIKDCKHQSEKMPLLMQVRLFYHGFAIKGTLLVNKRLRPNTIVIRPSMVKIKGDPKLSRMQSFSSLEIVSTSHRPNRGHTSKALIALLQCGGVDPQYFMELLQNAIEEAANATYDYKDALKLASAYESLDNSISERMILSGVPLKEPYLQSRLRFMAQLERRKLREGKLPIDHCYNIMGTTDPTGKLGPKEVCLILDGVQISGPVLVYKFPGIHLGDIHVLTSKQVSGLEELIGYSGHSGYVIFFPTCGMRSLADEMANSDFDGDKYWVSTNPKLLEGFKKQSEPWIPIYKPKNTNQKGPQDFDASDLEKELFNEYLDITFKPSYATATSCDCWLTYMDQYLMEQDENQKKSIEAKMNRLVNIYYMALDAPKYGNKIIVDWDLRVPAYPHFMERKKESYNSTSILGRIYDAAGKSLLQQSENVEPIQISMLPCFTEVEATPACRDLWEGRYKEYLTKARELIDLEDKEEKNVQFELLYEHYKYLLYRADEFKETKRELTEVYAEACVIFRVAYERARAANNVNRCGFAWKVAGDALCHLSATKYPGQTVLVPIMVARKLYARCHGTSDFITDISQGCLADVGRNVDGATVAHLTTSEADEETDVDGAIVAQPTTSEADEETEVYWDTVAQPTTSEADEDEETDVDGATVATCVLQ